MSKPRDTLIAIIAILCVFSIPMMGIMQPLLMKMIPFLYIAGGIGIFTLAARNLLGYQHSLRMEEIREKQKLAEVERQNYLEADRLIREHASAERTAARSGWTESELLKAAEQVDETPTPGQREKENG